MLTERPKSVHFIVFHKLTMQAAIVRKIGLYSIMFNCAFISVGTVFRDIKLFSRETVAVATVRNVIQCDTTTHEFSHF